MNYPFLHKFYTVKKENIKQSRRVSVIFSIVFGFTSNALGAFVILYYDFYELGTPDILGQITPNVLNIALPEILFAFIVILLLAAAMSTLSSIALIAAASICVDLLKTFTPKTKDKALLMLMRILYVIFIGLSVVLALTDNNIISLLSYSWGITAALFLALLTYGLFMKNATKKAAIITMSTVAIIAIGGIITVKKQYASHLGALLMIFSIILFPLVNKFILKNRAYI